MQLECLESGAGGGADPLELLFGGGVGRVRSRAGVDDAATQVDIQTDDVRMARRERQNLAASAPDEDRRPRLLKRFRSAVERGHPVVVALEGARLVPPQPV